MQTVQTPDIQTNSNLKSAQTKNSNLNGSSNHSNSPFIKDVKNFYFSKKNHFEFFRNNNYDIELLGKRIDAKICTLFEYQILLVYSFIRQNVAPGSRILEIGNSNSVIFKKIKNQYECWDIGNIEVLSADPFSENVKIPIKQFEKDLHLSKNSYNYFDFVFSISAFENLPHNENAAVYNNIIYNLYRFSKPGSYEIHTFALYPTEKSFKVNNFFFHFFKENHSVNKTLNDYSELKSISNDTDVHFIKKSINDAGNLKVQKKFFSKKINVVSYNFIKRKVFQLSKITKSNSSHFIKKTPAYIFHHLMKCGGTSMAISLKKWFNLEDEFMYKPGEMNNFEINTFIKYKLNVDNLTSDTCIRGHYHDDGYYLHQRYPEALQRKDEFRIFTFVRDPLDLRISLYYYLKNLGVYYNDISLETSLKGYSNFISTRFPCDESNYEEILSRYFFIGIVEHMQESFDKLASIIGKKKIKLPVVNTSEKDSKVSDLSPAFIKKFKEDNKLDYMIYNYCLDKFNKI